MRVIVCGSRSWTDKKAIFEALRGIAPEGKAKNLRVVHGGCKKGADWLTHQVMRGNCEVHPADWKAYGKGAGFVRNQKMAKLGADLCLAFWDGESPGTLNMMELAEKAGIPVKVILKG